MGWEEYRESSKSGWGRHLDEKNVLSLDEIKLGCLLRISDSLEKMERPYIELLQDIEYYKELELENGKLKKTIAGLKGWVNKTKKELHRYKS